MIAMSMLSTYDEYRRDRIATAPVYTPPARPVRRAMLYVLSQIGLGMGGIAVAEEDDILGIG